MIPDACKISNAAYEIKSRYIVSNNWECLEFGCKKIGEREVIVFGSQEIDASEVVSLINDLAIIFQH